MRPLRFVLPALLLVFGSLSAQREELLREMKAAWSQRKWSRVAQVAERLTALDPRDAMAWYRFGYALHAQRKYDLALPAHLMASKFARDPRVQQPATYNVACVYAIRGDRDRAFAWLEKAIEIGFNQLQTLRSDPDLEKLRSDPRFSKLVKRLVARSPSPRFHAFATTTKRRCSRLNDPGEERLRTLVAVGYAAVPWKYHYEGILKKTAFVGRRWRLGANAWTSLDTNVPLILGGRAIPAGHYYLTLTHHGERRFVLTVLDSQVVRRQRLDSYHAHRSRGGIAVPMRYSTRKKLAPRLLISLRDKQPGPGEGTLSIRFGPHEVRTSLRVGS